MRRTSTLTFFLLLALSLSVKGAITVNRIQTSNTQALIEYVAPDYGLCTHQVADMDLPIFISAASGDGTTVTVTTRGLQSNLTAGQVIRVESTGVSQWDTWQTVNSVASDGLTFTFLNSTPGSFTANGTTVPYGNIGTLVHDVNSALFSNSQYDSINDNSLVSGRVRTMIVGKRIKVETASDGLNYSRVLQANARHIDKISCSGGSDILEVPFKTTTIPLGNAAMVDWPGSQDTGGQYKLPYFNPRGQLEAPSGVGINRVIEPGSGMMWSLGQMRQEVIDADDIGIASTNTTVMPTSPVNWTGASNIISDTDSSAYASYSGATQDPICIKPNIVHSHQNDEFGYPSYSRLAAKFVDSFQLTLKGAYAVTGTGSDRDLEVAIRFDGVCDVNSPFTRWQTVPLTNSSSNVLFPAATVPKAAFGDWINPGDTVPSKVHTMTYKNNVLISDGSSTVTLPNTAATDYWANFKDHWKYSSGTTGTPIMIGGDLTTCTGGTAYYAQTFNHPKSITLNTTVSTATGQNICVPQTVFMIRKKTTATNEIRIQYVGATIWESYEAGTDSSGSRKRTSFLPVTDGLGNVGFIWQGGTGFYWVSQDTMETRRFMGNWIPSSSGNWDHSPCNVDGISSSNVDPYSFTCTTVLGAVNVPLRITMHWSGAGAWKSNRPAIGYDMFPLCTDPNTPTPNPCITAVKILGDGTYTLGDLLQAKYPAFDKTKFTVCSLQEPEGSKAPFRCSVSGQDTASWLGVWDFDKLIGDYNPADQSTNPVVGGLSFPKMDYGVMHFNQLVSTNLMQVSPKQGRVDGSAGDGPFIMRTGDGSSSTPTDRAVNATTDMYDCPAPLAALYGHTKCTDLIFTSQPFDPDPIAPSTGAPGEYGSIEVGQTLTAAKCNTLEAPLPSPNEYPGCLAITADPTVNYCYNLEICARRAEATQVLSITGTAPNIQITVGRQQSPVGSPVDHAAGTRWFTGGGNGVSVPLSAGFAMWDFVLSPDASNPAGFKGTLHSSDHGTCADRACIGVTEAGIEVHLNPTAASLAAIAPIWSRDAYSHFNFKAGLRFSNTVENYVAGPPYYGSSTDPTLMFAVNSRPLFRQQQADNIWSKIGGTTYLYKAPQTNVQTWGLNYKGLPFLAYSNNHPIKEVSGQTTLSDTQGDNYKFCIAIRANDCISGSKPTEMYMNVPFINPIDNSGYANCPNMEYREDNSICTAITHWTTNQGVEYNYGFGPDIGNSAHFRKLGGWWIRNTRGGTFNDPKVFANGRIYGPLSSHWALDHGGGTFFAKVPKVQAPDGKDRRFWVQVPITGQAPVGASYMQVEFGYDELSVPNGGFLRCSGRNENCLAVSQVIPKPWGLADGIRTDVEGYANWYGGDYTPTSTSPVTFTIAAGHGLGDDSRVYPYGTPIERVTYVSPTVFTLPDSAIGSGQIYLTFTRPDSPWLFPGDGCTVRDVLSVDSTKTKIICVNEHLMQTNNRVCINSVGGKTGVNGCWPITWTGNATFTIPVDTTAQSTYTSGGTVTPGGEPCTSGCTVTIPALSKRTMFFRRKYLNSVGTTIYTQNPPEVMITP